MTKRAEVSCENCFFRRAELCALVGNRPCPTFRPATQSLAPLHQPRLVPRPPLQAHAAA